jgi:hypothetical protein
MSLTPAELGRSFLNSKYPFRRHVVPPQLCQYHPENDRMAQKHREKIKAK